MSDRSEAIKQLRLLKADINNGLAFVSKTQDKHKALESLDMAIASMETDEAYQLEYESTTRNCFECKYSKDNHNSGTEECHLCMWENQYTPTTKNDLGVDCISRQVVDDYIAKLLSGYLYDEERERLEKFSAWINELPSVLPKIDARRKGHWDKEGACPFCDYLRHWRDDNYCAHCGADLRKDG